MRLFPIRAVRGYESMKVLDQEDGFLGQVGHRIDLVLATRGSQICHGVS